MLSPAARNEGRGRPAGGVGSAAVGSSGTLSPAGLPGLDGAPRSLAGSAPSGQLFLAGVRGSVDSMYMLYKISRDGAELGEFDEATVRRNLEAGFLLASDYAWSVGMTEWRTLDQLGLARPGPYPSAAPAAPVARPSGYVGWMVAGFLMPYLCAWRIIFDKTLGYSRSVKIAYAFWVGFFLLFVVSTGAAGGFSSQAMTAKELAYRKAHPYEVADNQESPMRAGGVIGNAEGLIRQRLKAPSTAKFSDYSKTSWDKTYDDGETQFYVVSGWVESQNSFGVMLRSKYLICYSANDHTVYTKYLRIGETSSGAIPEECKRLFSK